MSNVCIIPARGGSTRIQRKNIRSFMGKPIITYAIENAVGCSLFDRVIVSTDDDEISEIAQSAGADVIIRPAALAKDHVGTQEVMRHAVTTASGYEMACCLYATTPLLTSADLIKGWQRLHAPGTIYAMSVGTDPLQDAGGFYWGHAWAFRDGVMLIGSNTAMIPIEQNRVCDINTHEDWERAEMLYRQWKAALGDEGREE